MAKNIKTNTLIVGAGPAGIGMAICLEELGIKDYMIIDKGSVGESFKNWPKETKLLTPSFTSNMFFQPDLNAISPLTSPAYSYNTERLTGDEYAGYLKHMCEHFNIKVNKNKKVIKIDVLENNVSKDIVKERTEINSFKFETILENGEIINSKYTIWAGGEFSNPKSNTFSGSELCVHYGQIRSFKEYLNENKIDTKSKIINTQKIVASEEDLELNKYIIIGGYEAGMDSAYNLAKNNCKVLVFDSIDRLDNNIDDPSKALSPYTVDRVRDYIDANKIVYHTYTKVNKVTFNNIENIYEVFVDTLDPEDDSKTLNSKIYKTKNKPILGNGFSGVPDVIKEHINILEDGNMDINNFDESNKVSNLFFVGPSIHRGNIILCFIYKFRMRCSIAAEELAKRKGVEEDKIKEFVEYYKKYNMYLENVESCGVNCTC